MAHIEFQRILDNANIEDVISAYVPLAKHGKTFTACCPLHSEKSPSFHVWPETQSYHCFGCGSNGDAATFIKELLGVELGEALAIVASLTGQAPPKFEQKTPAQVAKEEATSLIWRACQADTGLAGKLAKIGWLARGYDPAALKQATSSMGIFAAADIKELGLAPVTPNASATFGSAARFIDLDDAVVLAGTKIGEDAPTGFVVLAQKTPGALTVSNRVTANDSPAAVIIHSKLMSRDTRIGIERVLLTEFPLLALVNNRNLPTISSAAPYWRSQDVSNVRRSFPNAQFIIDSAHFSDASLQNWITQMSSRAGELLVVEKASDKPVPFITAYIEDAVTEWNSGDAQVARDRAQFLMQSLSSPTDKLVVRAAFRAQGLGVAMIKGKVANPPPAKKKAAAKTAVAPADPARLHLLENVLIGLPYLDASQWKRISPEQFGEHSQMAQAITAFLEDPISQNLNVDHVHATFTSFVRHLAAENHVPAPILDFWIRKVHQHPSFQEKSPRRDSYEGSLLINELTNGLTMTIDHIERQRMLSLSYAASADPEAEEQLRMGYGNQP